MTLTKTKNQPSTVRSGPSAWGHHTPLPSAGPAARLLPLRCILQVKAAPAPPALPPWHFLSGWNLAYSNPRSSGQQTGGSFLLLNCCLQHGSSGSCEAHTSRRPSLTLLTLASAFVLDASTSRSEDLSCSLRLCTFTPLSSAGAVTLSPNKPWSLDHLTFHSSALCFTGTAPWPEPAPPPPSPDRRRLTVRSLLLPAPQCCATFHDGIPARSSQQAWLWPLWSQKVPWIRICFQLTLTTFGSL